MEPNNHNGSELNNVKETWDQNEKERASDAAGNAGNTPDNLPPVTPLDKVIQEEAEEYDNENKEERLLGGDRASVNDTDENE